MYPEKEIVAQRGVKFAKETFSQHMPSTPVTGNTELRLPFSEFSLRWKNLINEKGNFLLNIQFKLASSIHCEPLNSNLF